MPAAIVSTQWFCLRNREAEAQSHRHKRVSGFRNQTAYGSVGNDAIAHHFSSSATSNRLRARPKSGAK
jgi:hypothetical protein